MKPNVKRVLLIALGIVLLAAAVLLIVLLPRSREGSWRPAAEPDSNFTGSAGNGELFSGPSGSAGDTDPSDDGSNDATVPVGVQFPYDLADGRIQITSLFQYSGMNPDADFLEGENIGAIVVTNSSQDYLEELTVTAEISDGTVLTFRISDLPAGQTAWAFAEKNGVFDTRAVCVLLDSQSSFAQEPGPLGSSVSAEVQGVEVTLTNTSDSAIPAGELRCHMVLNGIYFGGTSYAYPVAALPAGQSVTVTAADCLLGDAAVCRLK